MEFMILGPLEARDGGRKLPLGGTKQRALLAMLLLHANEVVSTDRLIDELWNGARTTAAAKALSVAVARLRKALEPAGSAEESLLLTRPPGYELRLDPEQIDLYRFERLVQEARAEADPEAAAGKLDDALALWRGPPLADLAYESFAQAEIARLEELRLVALEDRFRAGLELGRHAELVGELDGLVARYPLRERLRAQLMLALYRSGRQAEALDAYTAGRQALVDELGIEPSRELRELQQAILQQAPELDLTAVGDGMAETPRSPFVGRQAELAELHRGLGDALAGHGRLFLLGGEPGIGKSSLASELVAHATARGARVLVGRCWEAGGAPPYWPWVQSLRAYLRESEPEALRAQVGAGAPDLAQLLPELRQILPGVGELAPAEPEAARFRLFDAATSFLKRAAEARPLVVVLDDLHAADEPSLLLLRFVAREISDSRMLLLCSFRDVDPRLGDPLASALADLAREAPTSRIALQGLSEREVAEYVELSTGIEPPPAAVQALHSETEGNPLFLVEVVRLLEGEGRLDEVGGKPGIPVGIRAVISRRVGALSEGSQNVLVRASVMGREFGLDAVSQVEELARGALLDALDEAMTERVLTEVPGSPGRLRFSHALVRETLYDSLTPARRMQLHQEIGEALEALYSADPGPHLAELAQHFCVAAPTGAADKAVEYARRAGDRAASQLGFEEAARLYGMALTLVQEPAERCELLLALGEAEARAGNAARSKHSFREAAELAEGQGFPEQLARAAFGYGGRLIWDKARDDDYRVPLLERALAALGGDDSPLRVRVLARLLSNPLPEGSFPPARKAALGREALEMAERIGDPATLAYALDGYVIATESPANTRELLALATRLLGVAAEVGDKERVFEAHEHRLGRLLELGEMRDAETELEAMTKLAQELQQPAQRWLVSACRTRIALLEGRFDDAESLISQTLDPTGRAPAWNATITPLQQYLLRREQGRLGEAEQLVRRSAADHPGHHVWRCALAQMTAELGFETESRHVLEALAADDFAQLPFQEMWLVSIGLLAETVSVLRDPPHASVLYELLLPYSDRVAVSYPEICTGAVSRYLGLLAATLARWNDAERHFEAACEMNERIGARPWLAYTKEDYARALLARNIRGARNRARQLLADAQVIHRELGTA